MARTVEKPARPYLGQKELDQVVAMHTELMSELWILRDRVTLLEHVLQSKGVMSRQELDDLVPEGELAAELQRERDALVQRVVGAAHSGTYSIEALRKAK
jgi:hypothetical protein